MMSDEAQSFPSKRDRQQFFDELDETLIVIGSALERIRRAAETSPLSQKAEDIKKALEAANTRAADMGKIVAAVRELPQRAGGDEPSEVECESVLEARRMIESGPYELREIRAKVEHTWRPSFDALIQQSRRAELTPHRTRCPGFEAFAQHLRKKWPSLSANHLARLDGKTTDYSSHTPWTDAAERWEVYRDDDKLVAVASDGSEQAITLSTFRTEYLTRR